MKRFMVVYQAGIANLFEIHFGTFEDQLRVVSRDCTRVCQADFSTIEDIARGVVWAGAKIKSCHANVAGDVVMHPWSTNWDEAPFSDRMNPVNPMKPRIKSWYGPGGAFMTSEKIEGITQFLEKRDTAIYYGSRHMVGETMTRDAVIILSEILGLEFCGDIT